MQSHAVQKRVRQKGLLSSVRYAQPAKQQVQMRVFADMRRAIRSLVDCKVPGDMALRNQDLICDDKYTSSPFYKKH